MSVQLSEPARELFHDHLRALQAFFYEMQVHRVFFQKMCIVDVVFQNKIALPGSADGFILPDRFASTPKSCIGDRRTAWKRNLETSLWRAIIRPLVICLLQLDGSEEFVRLFPGYIFFFTTHLENEDLGRGDQNHITLKIPAAVFVDDLESSIAIALYFFFTQDPAGDIVIQ